MLLNSYAQNFEDILLWRALKHVTPGCYVDVGAQDPTTDSVSLGFYQNGWRGIHVEPNPEYAEQLRLHRPDDVVVESAVTDQPDAEIPFYCVPDTGLSTTSPDLAAVHAENRKTVKEIRVSTTTLDNVFLLSGSRDVHWLKIDVEGAELQVLRSWNSPISPWIVLVESTLPNTTIEAFSEWEGYLIEKGYTFTYFDGINRFYVHNTHPELLAAFNAPPNVFDEAVLTGESSSGLFFELRKRLTAKDASIQALRGEISDANEVSRNLEIANRELASANGELASTNRELDQRIQKTRAQLAEEQRERELLDTSLNLLKEELALKSTQLEAESAKLDATSAALANAQKQLRVIEGSTSWAITRPLREANRIRQEAASRFLKTPVRLTMRRSYVWLSRHDRAKQFVKKLIQRFPTLSGHLSAFVSNQFAPVFAQNGGSTPIGVDDDSIDVILDRIRKHLSQNSAR